LKRNITTPAADGISPKATTMKKEGGGDGPGQWLASKAVTVKSSLGTRSGGAVELGEVVEHDEDGEAGGVDGGGSGDSGEVVAVSVGEEAVALQR
jgi:hypothetical protein